MAETYNFDEMPEADIVVNYVNTRLNKGLNTNIYIIGLSGTGKSSTSLRVGELINDTRDEDNKPNITVVDSLLELIKAIRTSKSGDIIIIEEVSVLFSSRRAMTGENVSISKVLDTCRKKELCLISNAPLWPSIDSHMRALGHIIIETLRVNKTDKVVVSKFHRLQTNPLYAKTYRHTMQRDGVDVARMFTRMPSRERWEAYEKQKDKFMDELYEQLEGEQVAKDKKRERQMGIYKYGLRGLSEKQTQMIKAVEVDKLSWDNFREMFEYSNVKNAKNGYKEAKEKQKILKSQNEKNGGGDN
jgi:Cdc6-like AAA superfamily ATPase